MNLLTPEEIRSGINFTELQFEKIKIDRAEFQKKIPSEKVHLDFLKTKKEAIKNIQDQSLAQLKLANEIIVLTQNHTSLMQSTNKPDNKFKKMQKNLVTIQKNQLKIVNQHNNIVDLIKEKINLKTKVNEVAKIGIENANQIEIIQKRNDQIEKKMDDLKNEKTGYSFLNFVPQTLSYIKEEIIKTICYVWKKLSSYVMQSIIKLTSYVALGIIAIAVLSKYPLTGILFGGTLLVAYQAKDHLPKLTKT